MPKLNNFESQTDVNDRFFRQLKAGREWENYLMTALPYAYPEYKVEHVQDILGFGIYRQNNNKYPDFRLTHKSKARKERIYIDAKRKRGYVAQPEHNVKERCGEYFVTCDKSFLDSYNNIVQQDIEDGWVASGALLFWYPGGAYLAPLEPHDWIDFGANGYGPDLSGRYWIKDLTPIPQFDSFKESFELYSPVDGAGVASRRYPLTASMIDIGSFGVWGSTKPIKVK